jgi:hypothetical protein
MNAQITEKINTKTIQFAWETQVLYLQIKEYGNQQRTFTIKDTPEDNLSYNIVTNTNSCSTYNVVVPATGTISIPSTPYLRQ